MKVNGKTILPGILFLIVVMLLVMMFSGNSYIPYSRSELFPKYGIYEGMEEKEKKGMEQKPKEVEVKNPAETPFSRIVGSENASSVTNFLGLTHDPKKEGFERVLTTLEPSIDLNKIEIIDKFSQVSTNSSKNDNSCYSAGLSNSKGPLCLSPELIDLLKTRGNNM